MANSSLPDKMPKDFAEAFAYLSALEKLSVDDMKLMILLETAGEPLYMRMAELAPNEEAAALLRQNGREETAHAHRLKRAIEILTGEPYTLPSLEENPYGEPPELPPLSPEMLAGVVGAEDGGNALYQGYADHEPNREVAELLRQNGREETRHGERVAQVIELLRT